MRLWSIHPRYLDAQGLVALWRESLLARAVLRGKTRGYQHHPQLARFRAHPLPVTAMNCYLRQIHAEASARGYNFDAKKVGPCRRISLLTVADGQTRYEWAHLMRKLRRRSPEVYRRWRGTRSPLCHPIFRLVKGPVAEWEKVG